MKISAELIAIGILGVALVSLGWKVSSDFRQEFKLEIQHLREEVGGDVASLRGDVAGLRGDVTDLQERMARLEGLFEGFTRGELAEQKK
ncbi:MAG: hypothetical protein F4X19_00135 [Acidobacteria bacterium]|nr:hypothetical protein [Acidobacteriota bacterium]